MATAAARAEVCSTLEEVLYLAFELSERQWKLGFTVGHGQKPREVSIRARDLGRLKEEVERAKRRFGLTAEGRVVSCYEAGRDGLWLHRYLEAQGIRNRVVDSSSIEVNRRARRAKSDGLDVRSLLGLLIRYEQGERKVWSVVQVPSGEEEDGRHLHREIRALKKDRVRHVNRIKGLLVTQGLAWRGGGLGQWLAETRMWDGQEVLAGLRQRVEYEHERLELVERQIRELEVKQREAIRGGERPGMGKVRKLMKLRGIGQGSAWLHTMEFFGWRSFRNRREVAALSGLVPTPYQSGDSAREQGVSKAGNVHVRWMAVEIAWGWVQFQPRSELTLWYWKRFGHGGSRQRRIGIVALARKLLIALWRYVEFDIVPVGAVLKG